MDLVRVLFLVSPYKRRMIERMVSEFSPQIVSEIASPRKAHGTGDRLRGQLSCRLEEYKTIRNQIRSFDPDMIYSDGLAYAAQLSLVAGKQRHTIVHLRGNWWSEALENLRYARFRDRLTLAPVCVGVWASLFAATKLTPICKWLEKIVNHRIPGKPTEVVYQGIDPSDFYPEDGFEFKKPAVAIIQNHTIHQKAQGLMNLKPVIEKLSRIQFYIAEGEDFGGLFKQRFLGQVKQHYSGLRNVHFVKDVTGPRGVRRMLTACDCYVLASNLDCCPATVLEASLMQKPVVASRVGGVPEIVLENETGWTIPTSSREEWTEKLTQVLEDDRLKRRFGCRGREWVSERFSWQNICRQVERIITTETRELR